MVSPSRSIAAERAGLLGGERPAMVVVRSGWNVERPRSGSDKSGNAAGEEVSCQWEL
jgi:hypothetical protein